MSLLSFLKNQSNGKREIPLTNYSQRTDIFKEYPSISNLLNWAYTEYMSDYCVVHCTDNGMFTVLKFRGPDMDSSTSEEMLRYIADLNTIIKKFGTGYVLYFDVQRLRSTKYDKSEMPTMLLARMEEERASYYESNMHYESEYYFVVYHEPPVAIREKITSFFVQESNARHNGEKEKADANLELYKKVTSEFVDNVKMLDSMLKHAFKELIPLNEKETLSYLHDIISDHHVDIEPYDMPIKDYITDAGLLCGREPKLGSKHMRIITIKSFPPISTPGIFNAFNYMNFEYRWVSRFICLSKDDAQKIVKNYRVRWDQQSVPLISTIRSMITNTPIASTSVDDVAVANAADAQELNQNIGQDYVSLGQYTMTMTVFGSTKKEADDLARHVIEVINSLGYIGYIETDNAVEAWRGSIPGNFRCNVRSSLVHSLNFCHFAPTTAQWSGDKKNKFLKGAVLLYTDSSGNTPFRLSLHVGQLGHTMICGPSGSGKSVLLNTIEAHFMKYKDANVFIFDKAASSRALTIAVGGNFYNLAAESNSELSFQPLAHINDNSEIKWAKEWLVTYLKQKNMTITPTEENYIWKALLSLRELPENQRTISNFSVMVQDQDIRQGLLPLTMKGSYGALFDNDKDVSGEGKWQVYEMETIMNTPAIVPPTLDYLFHRIETQLKTAKGPSIIVLDECWLFFDNPAFRDKLREYFKDMRKKNCSIIFATQNLADVVANKSGTLFTTVSENCPSRIYLPNPNATNEQNSEMYRAFGCNSKQIEIISRMRPQRDYYYACAEKGNRVFDLALQPSELAFVTATSKQDQQAINQLLKAGLKDDFIRQWLHYKGMDYEYPAIIKHLKSGVPAHI